MPFHWDKYSEHRERHWKLMRLVQDQQKVLDDFDAHILMKGSTNEAQEDEFYATQTKKLQELRKQLEECRLAGMCFRVQLDKRIKPNQAWVLEVTEMSRLNLYKVQVGEGTEPRIIESKLARVRDIDKATLEHNKKGPANSEGDSTFNGDDSNCCCVKWKNGQLEPILSENAHEILEVIGAHVRRANTSRIRISSLIKDHRKSSQIPYDSANEDHEARLPKLWALVFPNEELPSRKGEHWVKLGFQGHDPATDFRGMGILGLDMLLHFAETNQGRTFEICSRPEKHEYPWAITGINLCSLMFGLLNWKENMNGLTAGDPAWQSDLFDFLCSCYDEEDPFAAFFGELWHLFDHRWVEARATYMDFPRIIALVKEDITRYLVTQPGTMQEIRGMIQHDIRTRNDSV